MSPHSGPKHLPKTGLLIPSCWWVGLHHTNWGDADPIRLWNSHHPQTFPSASLYFSLPHLSPSLGMVDVLSVPFDSFSLSSISANGIVHCVLFPVWLLPISKTVLTFIDDVCINISFRHIAGGHSIRWIHHDLFTDSPADARWVAACLWLLQYSRTGMRAQGSAWTHASPWGDTCSTFYKNNQTFPKCLSHPHQRAVRGSSSCPSSSPALAVASPIPTSVG